MEGWEMTGTEDWRGANFTVSRSLIAKRENSFFRCLFDAEALDSSAKSNCPLDDFNLSRPRRIFFPRGLSQIFRPQFFAAIDAFRRDFARSNREGEQKKKKDR